LWFAEATAVGGAAIGGAIGEARVQGSDRNCGMTKIGGGWRGGGFGCGGAAVCGKDEHKLALVSEFEGSRFI